MWNLSLLLLPIIISVVTAQVDDYDTPSTDPVSTSDKGSLPPSKASLIFNHDSLVVDPGQRLQLDCGVEGDFRNCFWEKEGENAHTFQIEDVHQGVLKGLSKPDSTKGNECGMVINSVSANDHGKWTCKVFVFAKTLVGSKTIIVTVKPQQPSLDLNENPLVVEEGEEKQIACTVPAARPPARFRWFIGTTDITANSRAENLPTDDKGTYKSVSTLRYKFHPNFDKQLLKCMIEHPTLEEPESAQVALDVRFAPFAISSPQIYGIPMDSEYEIKFNFSSNPLPDMHWLVNGDTEIPIPGETGRYSTSIKAHIYDGTIQDNWYMASLRIREFTSDDVAVMYKLTAKNDLGQRNFDITLSTGPAPPDGGIEVSEDEVITAPDQLQTEDTVGTAALVSIIVIVIFILVLLAFIGVMRYRQMYCFGPKDKIKNHLKESGENLKEEHDTESAREPNNKSGKATNLLKNFTSMIKPKRAQKEPRLDKIEEGEGGVREEKTSPQQESPDGKSNNPSEIVYAELELNKNNQEANSDAKRLPESTEYAEIVGTIPDNKTRERKE